MRGCETVNIQPLPTTHESENGREFGIIDWSKSAPSSNVATGSQCLLACTAVFLHAVLFFIIIPVHTIPDPFPPGLVIQIPVDGLLDAGLEGIGRLPAQLVNDPRRVDGVAAVVSGAILDVGNQITFGLFTRPRCIQACTNQTDDIYIRPFVAAADIIGFAQLAFVENRIDAPTVVFDVQPVADIFAVAVDRQGLVF